MGLRSKGITLDTRQLISGALFKLQLCDGVVDDDKLWEFEDRCDAIENDRTRSLQSPGLLHASLGSAAADLRRVERVKDALDVLARSCERKLEVLKKRDPGIKMLPDDVLSDVFRLVVDEHDDKFVCPPELALSLVCTRFRFVAENTASLWLVDASVVSALTVTISENEWSKGLKQFIQLVIPHASRWKNFKFEAKIDDDVQRGFPKNLRSYLRDLHLPNLRTFVLDFKYDCETRRDRLDVFNIYKSWSMPNVHHIASSEVLLALDPFSSDAIRTFDFTWSVGICDAKGLIDLLVSLPNLTELRIGIVSDQADLSDVNFEPAENILPNLADLTIKTDFPFVLRTVLHRMCMLSLNKLRLIFGDPDPYGECMSNDDFLDVIPLHVSSSLKVLDYSFPNCHRDFLELHTIFRQFPRLENLSLDVPGFEPANSETPLDKVKMPPLRSFSVQLSGPPHNAFHPEHVVRALKANGRWEKFEYFEFKNGRVMTKQQAETLTEGKVKWSM